MSCKWAAQEISGLHSQISTRVWLQEKSDPSHLCAPHLVNGSPEGSTGCFHEEAHGPHLPSAKGRATPGTVRMETVIEGAAREARTDYNRL